MITPPIIKAVFNGDNVNAGIDRWIVGWMHANRVPLVMLSTTRTNNDAKGGIMGVLKLPGGISVPAMQELATAKSNGQRSQSDGHPPQSRQGILR